MEAIDILKAATGENAEGKYRSTIAFFVEKDGIETDDSLLDEFYVQKPIVQVAEFADAEGNEYYSLEFIYKSRRDADLKQHWDFLDRFIAKLSGASEEEENAIVLSVILLPIELRDQYSILAKPLIPDTIMKVEYAGDNRCSIKILVLKNNVLFLSHDDEALDRKKLEEEVMREVDEELAKEYGPLESQSKEKE